MTDDDRGVPHAIRCRFRGCSERADPVTLLPDEGPTIEVWTSVATPMGRVDRPGDVRQAPFPRCTDHNLWLAAIANNRDDPALAGLRVRTSWSEDRQDILEVWVERVGEGQP